LPYSAPFGGSLNFNAARSNATLGSMLTLFVSINPRRLGVFDVYPNRDQGVGPALAQARGLELTRVGLQPAEVLPPLFRAGGVEDTWGAVCCGRTSKLWAELPCGAATLNQWVALRLSDPRPFSFDLIVVAWDYSLTPNGTDPGIDDATKNQALPPGRTALAVSVIDAALAATNPEDRRAHRSFGLSSDLVSPLVLVTCD